MSRPLPSGSENAAPWQTPESHVSPFTSTPASSSAFRASATSGTRIAIAPNGSGANSIPNLSGSTSANVTLPVSNSTHVSVELGFFSSPSVST
jgi:hypothetical protein